METIRPERGEDLKVLAKRCDALYICPKQDGKRVGPLVAYAGKDETGKNYVGDIYFNFRKIERHPLVVAKYAEIVMFELVNMKLEDAFDTVCGIPHGGRSFGQELARIMRKQFVYADKKPIPTEPGKKQEYEWDLSQFEFSPGERLAVAEDVFNNFQNTDNTLAKIAETGARVVLLVGALNRSPFVRGSYTPRIVPFSEQIIPVVAAIDEPFGEYKQSDPEVAADIEAGNLELNVKKNWAKLAPISA